MASIFTYDPDPPHVSSPWPIPLGGAGSASDLLEDVIAGIQTPANASLATARAGRRAADADEGEEAEDDNGGRAQQRYNVTRLEAEPQEGPTEYKLHILLRPRGSSSLASLAASAAIAAAPAPAPAPATPPPPSPAAGAEATIAAAAAGGGGGGAASVPPPLSNTALSRQHRLEQLTTQLLWRLQQSSPYHSSSAHNLILPSLPEATPALQVPKRPAKLLPGLEESKGALYEIGVADDGTFVGLMRREMDESLNNLRAMAASLGCSVEVLRMVHIGDTDTASSPTGREKLYVVEAYVRPGGERTSPQTARPGPALQSGGLADETLPSVHSSSEQIRVSLTGGTTCGKSSLLGVLTTSTLDNGRGKSRLSLLKHRHEIASGMTSSVSQELMGYRDVGHGSVQVVNFASGNVSSWTDIHTSAEPRLAFVTDSAGHPRYRRTTVRGLVSWAPHWTLLCVPANHSPAIFDKGPGDEAADALSSQTSVHLSMAHLDLCLRLGLPLVIVITKLDIANKNSLRQVLSTILTTLKAAGRKPAMLPNDNRSLSEEELQEVGKHDLDEVRRTCVEAERGGIETTPVLFTSSVKGIGIRKLHALIRYLPLSTNSPLSRLGKSLTLRDAGSHIKETLPRNSTQTLFHVDDNFILSDGKIVASTQPEAHRAPGTVVLGRLDKGEIEVGDELLLGPFASGAVVQDEAEPVPGNAPDDPFLTPRSFTDALAKATSSPRLRASPADEWRRVRVVSVRNLRLPVRRLETGQVGTVGVLPVAAPALNILAMRKGMVLASPAPRAAHTFTARFSVEESSSVVVGSLAIIYCASVRAAAKIVTISLHDDHGDASPRRQQQQRRRRFSNASDSSAEEDLPFKLDDSDAPESAAVEPFLLVTFQFLSSRELLEHGAQVLVMPGGGPSWRGAGHSDGRSIGGLDGYVGQIQETFG